LSVKGVLEKIGELEEKVEHVKLDVLAVVPYAAYYFSYYAAKGINTVGCSVSSVTCAGAHVAALPLAAVQAVGLAGDALIDELKGESVCDEGGPVHLDPLHSFAPSWLPDPTVYGPGIHKNAKSDLEW
jgi:hypothetical protein